mmetsp:Transcript_13440/g.32043  ORF Transcript_13440/g.32043 Transcript_13440/m.32043 type:complete len:465 (+) Transcript_13440:92-1486(+)
MGPPRWAAGIDAFRTVPKDLAEASATGAVMTLVAVVTCAVLFICETNAFLRAERRTDVSLDSNQDSMLTINFDVTMLDMACDHVTVGVWDAFGSDRMNITKNIQKQRIDHKGNDKGHAYSDDELLELDFSDKTLSAEDKAELDSDWSSSSDQFKHDNFESVVDAHDYTFVNFYADWCPHCRMFGPTWDQFEKQLNSEQDPVVDADGVRANVRALKINCVDFEETCQQQKVQAFPTVRLYRRGGAGKNWADFRGQRQMDALVSFAKEEVRKRHIHTGAHYHDMFAESCRIKGLVEVARVPGTLHFQATHNRERTLNLAYTNVSHTVHSLVFGNVVSSLIVGAFLPTELSKHRDPLAGRSFTVSRFHQAPHHYLKVVHTKFGSSKMYQQTHQWSARNVARNAVPQAKFSYDLSPVEVTISLSRRRWYDYVTSVFAIIGGAFTFMSMTSSVLNVASSKFKASINKLG